MLRPLSKHDSAFWLPVRQADPTVSSGGSASSCDDTLLWLGMVLCIRSLRLFIWISLRLTPAFVEPAHQISASSIQCSMYC